MPDLVLQLDGIGVPGAVVPHAQAAHWPRTQGGTVRILGYRIATFAMIGRRGPEHLAAGGLHRPNSSQRREGI
jgi:hypothetical protein